MTITTGNDSAAISLTERQQKDAEMMSQPDLWNQLFLPVVRHPDKAPHHNGQVNAIAALDGRCEIVIGNIFDRTVDWKNADRMLYPSFEACVLDGWRVD